MQEGKSQPETAEKALYQRASPYAMAVLAVAIGGIARVLLRPLLGSDFPVLTFVPVVLFSAWQGGLGPGLLSVSLSTLLISYAWLDPLGNFGVARTEEVTGLLVFAGFGVGASLWSVAQQRAKRRAIERALRAEHSISQLLESISEAFCTLDQDFRYTYLNKEAEHLLGRSRDDLVGKSIFDVFPAIAGSSLESVYRRSQSERVPCSIENYYEPWDRWFEINIYPAGDGGLATYFRDISESKRHVEGLQERDERFRFTLDLSGVGTWDWNILTNEVRWSDNMEEIHGLPRGRFGGNLDGFLSDVNPEYRPHVLAKLQEAIETKTQYVVEYRQARSDGTEGWMEAKGQALYDAEGRPYRMLGVCTNITARKLAEVELLETAARLRAIVETAVDAIITIDERGIIQTFNPAAESIFGYSSGEVTGKNVSMLMPEPDRGRHDGYIRHYLETGERRIIGSGREVTGLKKDGTLFPMDLSVSATPLKDGLLFTGIVRDITRRKEAEEALRRALDEKDFLLRTNEELKQLTYAASHDLQEPLRTVASFTQILARRYSGALDEEADQYIGYIIGGVHRMSDLIRGLLHYGRVLNAAAPLEPVSSTKVLEEALHDLHSLIGESGAVVTHDDLPRVCADRAQLRIVFQNLVGNGIKYRGNDVPRIHVSAERQGVEVVVCVSDNGLGFDAAYADRIFHIFKRLHHDRPGTGIGLAICKKIVERHGGRIWAESEEGKGARFYFSVPEAEATACSSGGVPDAHARGEATGRLTL